MGEVVIRKDGDELKLFEWFNACHYVWFTPQRWFYGLGTNLKSEYRETFYSCPVKILAQNFPTAIIEGEVDITRKNIPDIGLQTIPISLKITTTENESDISAEVVYNHARLLVAGAQSKNIGCTTPIGCDGFVAKLDVEVLCSQSFFLNLISGIEKYHTLGESRLNLNFIDNYEEAPELGEDEYLNAKYLSREIFSIFLDMLHNG